MKKQMRDIPETLQDKMGQKMRLTVNGLVHNLPANLTTTTPVVQQTSCLYSYTYVKDYVLSACSESFLSTDAKKFL